MTSELGNRPLRVSALHATRKGDPVRGPAVFMNPADAQLRLLTDGELAWVYGPRRHELATVVIQESMGRGEVALRDVAGASPSEIVRVMKPDLDRRVPDGLA